MKLYSYCIPYDDGAAPNPYWEICTLTICKPAIRRTVSVGDWIVGTGSKNVKGHGDLSNKLVYAMKVTDKKTLQEYDQYCNEAYPNKIPDWTNKDYRIRLGDCIYDFSQGKPKQRKGVHSKMNENRDLSGKYSLISDHFYYFGDKPIDIPMELQPIVNQRQAHRSNSNQPYIEKFLNWIDSGSLTLNKLYGKPQLDIFKHPECQSFCSGARAKEK